MKKLISVLLAVMLVAMASAMVIAEISKDAGAKSDSTFDNENTHVDAPVNVPQIKTASIKDVLTIPTDAQLYSMDNLSEIGHIAVLTTYGKFTSEAMYLPQQFEIPNEFTDGFDDMLANMEFTPVSGEEMVAEAKTAISSVNNESIIMSMYSEQWNEIINVSFYRSKDAAVWAPYVRIYEPIAKANTEGEFENEMEKLKTQGWEAYLYKINPETLNANLLETALTEAMGGSLEEYIDFVAGLRTMTLNQHNAKSDDETVDSEYGLLSYYMEAFPNANVMFTIPDAGSSNVGEGAYIVPVK